VRNNFEDYCAKHLF